MSRRPISKAEMAASATAKGGFTAKQLRLWGVRWPPPRGWVRKILRDGVPASCPYPPGFDAALVPVEVVHANPALAFGPQPAPIEMPADALEIYTDGSCDPNPGPGGWAFVVYRGTAETHSAFGGEGASTNNRMELQGIIQALRWLAPKQAAVIWTDSQYCQKGCTAWRHGWKRPNWTRGKSELANNDLWIELSDLLDTRLVDVRWVRGHAGTIGNERADELAEEGRQSVLDGDCLAQSGRASEANPGRAGARRRGKPVVRRGEHRAGSALTPVEDECGPVLIKRGDPAVAGLVGGGVK